MTQLDLEKSIADRTGESLRIVRRHGFQLCEVPSPTIDHEPVDLYLDCPFCGHAALQSSSGIAGLPTSAECPRCDIYFDYEFDELYTPAEARDAVRGVA